MQPAVDMGGDIALALASIAGVTEGVISYLMTNALQFVKTDRQAERTVKDILNNVYRLKDMIEMELHTL